MPRRVLGGLGLPPCHIALYEPVLHIRPMLRWSAAFHHLADHPVKGTDTHAPLAMTGESMVAKERGATLA